MEQSKVPSGLNFLAGIWVLISPWILAFSGVYSADWNNVIIGTAVLLLAASRLWWSQGTWASWVNLILGIWLIISPYALGFAGYSTPTTNNIIFGIVVGILALWSAYSMPVAGMRHNTPTFTSAEPTEEELRRRR
jgi:hypothetical protein